MVWREEDGEQDGQETELDVSVCQMDVVAKNLWVLPDDAYAQKWVSNGMTCYSGRAYLIATRTPYLAHQQSSRA
jgi:hypothetical protein